MKKILFIISIILLSIFIQTSCTKPKEYKYSTIVFYTSVDLGHGSIKVTPSGANTSVNAPVISNVANYTVDDFAASLIVLNNGSYTYKAVATDGTIWTGSFEASNGDVFFVKIN